MIAQFETNTFIKSARLNELVDGVNGLNENIVVLTANTTKTVGAGGDFATLGLALDWCKKVLSNGFKVNLNILSGHLISEQIILENCDFRFLQIDSVDDTVYMNKASMTVTPNFVENYSYCPAFSLYKTNMGKINTKLRLNDTANPNNVLDMYMRDSQVEFMKRKGTYNPPYMWKNSELVATEYESSQELYVLNNSKASFYGIKLIGEYAGIKARYNSTINIFGSSDFMYNNIIKSTATSNLSMIQISEGSLISSDSITLDYASSDNNYSPLEVKSSEVVFYALSSAPNIISPNCTYSIQVSEGGVVRGKAITKTKPYNVTPHTWSANGYVGV